MTKLITSFLLFWSVLCARAEQTTVSIGSTNGLFIITNVTVLNTVIETNVTVTNITLVVTNVYEITTNVTEITSNVTNVYGSGGDLTALTDGPTIIPDLSVSDRFIVTLGGNRTLGVPSNIPAGGKKFTVWFVQDSIGSRSISFPTNYVFGTPGIGDITGITLSLSPSKGDCAIFEAFSTNSVVRPVGFVRGYKF